MLGRVPALTLDEPHRLALERGTIGGITLFKENVSDLEQLARLTADIIKASSHNLVLAVDQEGGAVQRFDEVLSPLPSAMALSALDFDNMEEDREWVETITAISAGQLKTLGINMLLAPTLDLQTNARNPIICTRAYGDDPKKTAKIGGRVAAAIEAAGLVAVGKHFPGHGSTSEDSHMQLALVDKSESALMVSDLVPFAELAKQLRAILVGHIWLPQLVEAECPATLSKKIVKDLLGVKLGFTGLVVSDDMIMKAITQGLGLGEACVQALLAGVDLLLVCGKLEETMEAVNAIVQATVSGRISEERLMEAAGKLDALFPGKPGFIDADDKKAMADFAARIEQDTLLSRRCSARAIAVLERGRGENSKLSLTGKKTITVVAPDHPRYPMALAADLRQAMADDVSIIDRRYPVNPGQSDIKELLTDLDGFVVYITYRSAINCGQIELGQALLAQVGSEIMHVSVDSPYDFEYLKGFDRIASLATFDPSCQAMAALADVLTGEATAAGKCPLKIKTA